jgi:hypothetical protein
MAEQRRKTPRQPFSVGGTPLPAKVPVPDPAPSAPVSGTGESRSPTSELELRRGTSRPPVSSQLLPVYRPATGNTGSGTVSMVLDRPLPVGQPGPVPTGPFRPIPADDPPTQISVGVRSTSEHPAQGLVPCPPDVDVEAGTAMLSGLGLMETDSLMEAQPAPRQHVPYGIDPNPDDDDEDLDSGPQTPAPGMIRAFTAPPTDEIPDEPTGFYRYEAFEAERTQSLYLPHAAHHYPVVPQSEPVRPQAVPRTRTTAAPERPANLAADEAYQLFTFLEFQASWWTRVLFVFSPDFYRMLKELRAREIMLYGSPPSRPDEDASDLIIGAEDYAAAEQAEEGAFFRDQADYGGANSAKRSGLNPIRVAAAILLVDAVAIIGSILYSYFL